MWLRRGRRRTAIFENGAAAVYSSKLEKARVSRRETSRYAYLALEGSWQNATPFSNIPKLVEQLIKRLGVCVEYETASVGPDVVHLGIANLSRGRCAAGH